MNYTNPEILFTSYVSTFVNREDELKCDGLTLAARVEGLLWPWRCGPGLGYSDARTVCGARVAGSGPTARLSRE